MFVIGGRCRREDSTMGRIKSNVVYAGDIYRIVKANSHLNCSRQCEREYARNCSGWTYIPSNQTCRIMSFEAPIRWVDVSGQSLVSGSFICQRTYADGPK